MKNEFSGGRILSYRGAIVGSLLILLLGAVSAWNLAAAASTTPTTHTTPSAPKPSFFRRILDGIPMPHHGGSAPAFAGQRLVSLTKLNGPDLEARISEDLKAIRIYRNGLQGILAYVGRHPELFPQRSVSEHMLDARGRDAVRGAWQSFYDYLTALDALGRYYANYYRLGSDGRANALMVRRAAFLLQYRAALEFIAATQHDPTLDTLLNEALPELGLPEDSFASFKFRFLNGACHTHWAALEAVARVYTSTRYPELRVDMDADNALLAVLTRGPAQLMTFKDAMNLMRRTGHDVWFPVQAGVADLMGHTKLYRWGHTLISREQLARMLPQLDPGDILLERREWQLTNMGLPGFWTHAALYVGTPAERRNFFNECDVKTWVSTQGQDDFENMLQARCAQSFSASLVPDADGQPPRIIEAIGAGVVFTSLEHSAGADCVVVLRPRLSKKEKAMAILRAFSYAGRPYDYDFDFLTDSALVCTELVYKSFEPGPDRQGVKFQLQELLDHQLLPANEIARQFVESNGTPAQQLDFVLFLDGRETEGRAVDATLDDFRQSWRRPKWHVLNQALGRLNPLRLVANNPADE